LARRKKGKKKDSRHFYYLSPGMRTNNRNSKKRGKGKGERKYYNFTTSYELGIRGGEKREKRGGEVRKEIILFYLD